MSILRALYDGSLCPAEYIKIPCDPKVTEKITKDIAFLKSQLSEEDADRLDRLTELIVERSVECRSGFIYGFKLGIRLIIEILAGNEKFEPD